MEFLNIGGGELLIIVLLAIILFGPEDILKIMRTIGGYVRKIQQMWAQMSSGLKGEFVTDDMIPEEIQETIKETRDSVTEVQKTLSEIQTAAAADLNAAKDAIAGIEASAEADFNDAKAAVTEIKTSLVDVESSVKTSIGEIPKAIEVIATTSTTQTSPTSKKGETVLTNVDTSNRQPQTNTTLPAATLPMTDGEQAQTAETTTLAEDL